MKPSRGLDTSYKPPERSKRGYSLTAGTGATSGCGKTTPMCRSGQRMMMLPPCLLVACLLLGFGRAALSWTGETPLLQPGNATPNLDSFHTNSPSEDDDGGETASTGPALKPEDPGLICYEDRMTLKLPGTGVKALRVRVKNRLLPVASLAGFCKYSVTFSGGYSLFTTSFKGCNVKIQEINGISSFVLTVFFARTGGAGLVMRCPQSTPKSLPSAACGVTTVTFELPEGPLEEVTIIDRSGLEMLIKDAPDECAFYLMKGDGMNVLTISYYAKDEGCPLQTQNNTLVFHVTYKDAEGRPGSIEQECLPFEPPAVCGPSSMSTDLPEGPLDQVFILDGKNNLVAVKANGSCGYGLVQGIGNNYFMAPYDACDVLKQNIDGHVHYSLSVSFSDVNEVTRLRHMKCRVLAKREILPPPSLPPHPAGVSVSCSEGCMTVLLPAGPLDLVKVKDDSNNLVGVQSAPSACGYTLEEKDGKTVFTVSYMACHVKTLNNWYVLTVLFTPYSSRQREVTVSSCPVPPNPIPQEGCLIPAEQQLPCGPSKLSPALCRARGCCMNPKTRRCFYPLEMCTADEQFVFAVYRKSFNPEVNPASLALAGDQSCLPVLCTPDYAIFKFPVTGCGTRTFVVGETRVYLAEVQSLIQRRQWTYGLVTSDSPFRQCSTLSTPSLLVECRYSKGNVASTGFLVKTPTDLRPAPHLGVFQVQLQIAKDGTFSQFYPSSSLPVSLLLGSRVYLELRLINPTDPSLVLLVHYCIAYPRSSSAVWVLLYQGCPNVLDYGSSASLHVDGQPPHSKFRRRFSLRTFQFLSSGLALDEEISFMCSTEVCSPDQRRCNEGCFDGRDTPISVDPNMRLRCAGNPCPGRVMLEGA
ncbi:uncharacterized protein LOC131699596 [Acipenser ruthenus]|uniref:uncharacterized protein LOC131699596 n=1 Tax=Acipenser ruthenus TaxID=7906 RepID=UPI00274221FE|nr:uncharacterized protein LOC131699596 [Acipenser ruthenus]